MVSLAPEWAPDSLSTLVPLGPSIVAWGNDPMFQGMSASYWTDTVKGYGQIGVDRVALNIFMLSASAKELSTHPELQRAVVLDIAGEKVVPPWLTETANGVPSYWGCTNNPIFRAHLDHRIELSSGAAGALLHIDDHLGTAASMNFGGCFCEHCMRGFRSWLKANRTVSQLAGLSVDSVDTFDYAARVRNVGITTRVAYISTLHYESLPLAKEFLAFQRDAIFSVIHHLRNKAAAVWGREVALGVNAWNMSASQLADAHLVDYFANEIEHIGKEDLQPPFSYLLGTALGRPIFSTASGGDWVVIKKTNAVKRVQAWLAQAYAFGHSFMYAYRKWGYSTESGTIWYDTPIATYLPVAELLHQAPSLFDGLEPIRSVAVLYDAATEERGKSQAMKVVAALHGAKIPVSLVVAGNPTLRRTLTASDLAPYTRILLAQPLSPSLSADQKALLDAARTAGKLVDWTSLADFTAAYSTPVGITGTNGVWALPRKAEAADAPLVVHLLNRDYDATSDTFAPKSAFVLKVQSTLLGHAPKLAASYHAPGQASQSVAVTAQAQWIFVTIPSLDYWAIVSIE
jgi:hypothetical protein